MSTTATMIITYLHHTGVCEKNEHRHKELYRAICVMTCKTQAETYITVG